MSHHASRAAAWSLVGLVVVLTAASLPLTTRTHGNVVEDLAGVPLAVACCVIGAIVALRQPRHPMGWILLGLVVSFLVNTVASDYLILDYRMRHGALPLGFAAVLFQPAWAPGVVCCGLAVLLFPDGHLPRNGLRWVAWAVIALGAAWIAGAYAIAAGALIGHNVHIDSTGNLLAIDHPAGIATWWGQVQDIFFPVLFGSWVLWFVWQVRSYAHSTGGRRLQLKWLLSGITVFGASLPLLFSSSNGSSPFDIALNAVAVTGLAALPISIGIGILKFRLYEIDRLISRTISYAVLTATLVALFAGIVTLATRVLPFSSPVAVAASTLAAAAVFNPLRLRIQHLVDRRFNRARYDAEAIVAAFTVHLQDAIDLDTVRGDLLDAVGALQPVHCSMWIRPRSGVGP